ncbi:MAG: CoxG family protein [Xanthobacteraceae bacterium]
MELVSERLIQASQEETWQALNDAEILRVSIPGCTELVRNSDTQFAAKVTLKVGPIKANFAGKVDLTDIDAPNGYTLVGEGSGGIAGFAKGRAIVKLEAAGPTQTRLIYDVKADVGGKLAQLGARLIESTSKKLADQFFQRFDEAVSHPVSAEAK